jgi:SEC-C motif-containing protein
MQTTHPANSQYRSNPSLWAEEITQFCRSTQFHRLEIIDSQEDGSSATVTFLARLSQHNQDISFREKSDFEKVDGKWLYRSGQVESTPPS